MSTIYHYAESRYLPRINRLSFLIRWMCLLVGGFVASKLMDHSSVVLKVGGVAVLLFLFMGMFRWILIPRLRDMGVEPVWAWSLLLFVHPVSFLFLLTLLLTPTDAFTKRQRVI